MGREWLSCEVYYGYALSLEEVRSILDKEKFIVPEQLWQEEYEELEFDLDRENIIPTYLRSKYPQFDCVYFMDAMCENFNFTEDFSGCGGFIVMGKKVSGAGKEAIPNLPPCPINGKHAKIIGGYVC